MFKRERNWHLHITVMEHWKLSSLPILTGRFNGIKLKTDLMSLNQGGT